MSFNPHYYYYYYYYYYFSMWYSQEGHSTAVGHLTFGS